MPIAERRVKVRLLDPRRKKDSRKEKGILTRLLEQETQETRNNHKILGWWKHHGPGQSRGHAFKITRTRILCIPSLLCVE